MLNEAIAMGFQLHAKKPGQRIYAAGRACVFGSALEDEVESRQSNAPIELDRHFGGGIVVRVEQHNCLVRVGVKHGANLAGCIEVLAADEAEGLIAGGKCVGVDVPDVDVINQMSEVE